MTMCVYANIHPVFLSCMNLPEYGLIKSKHVGECKLQNRTIYISCVKKVQIVWIIQIHIQNFSFWRWGGGGVDPEAICNLHLISKIIL
jgi:hypothetical protein